MDRPSSDQAEYRLGEMDDVAVEHFALRSILGVGGWTSLGICRGVAADPSLAVCPFLSRCWPFSGRRVLGWDCGRGGSLFCALVFPW
ncbi:hypothetical protein L6452_44061 [Arctium lappa]|uniref:Uncharacterized protein n=1 Tax=Arctium lappa TaxID=4217 RepID=A0ACB8XF02_ARCLA|nr:hypothetical protein L6452_44061 [Arctium lappa]